jgi:kynurenine formamidase
MTFPFKIIDLTHTLTPSIPTWDGRCGFNHMIHHDYDPKAHFQFRTHKIQMNEGIGTHMDAPAHCHPGAKCIIDINLEDLIVPCVLIDVAHKSHEKYCILPEDIIAFEENHGAIEPGSFVIFHTGWGEQFWQEPEKYHNRYLFPSLSARTVPILLDRNIVGIGIDTLSPDRPDNGFPVHKAILGAGKYIIENVANASRLPAKGSYSLALPLKIKDGTEAPLRFIALIPT